MTRGNYDSANNMLAYSNGNCPVLKTERGWKSLWVQILPQAPYAVLTELVRCRIANPRSGETLREFKSLRLRQRPGRARMMWLVAESPQRTRKCPKGNRTICGVPDGEPSVAVALQRNARVQAHHLLTAPKRNVCNDRQGVPFVARVEQRAPGRKGCASFYHLSSFHTASRGRVIASAVALLRIYGSSTSAYRQVCGSYIPAISHVFADMFPILKCNKIPVKRANPPQSAIFAPVITL